MHYLWQGSPHKLVSMFSLVRFWRIFFSSFILFWDYHSTSIHSTVQIFVEDKCSGLPAKSNHSDGSCFEVTFFFLNTVLPCAPSSIGIWSLFHNQLQWRAKVSFDWLTKLLANHLVFWCSSYSLLSLYFCHTPNKSGL